MRILNTKFAITLILIMFVNASFATNTQKKTFIFFYASYCKYCSEMADILVNIRQKHNIRIIANSLDGGAIEQFPDALHNDDITRKFKIVSTPTIVAVDVQNKGFEVISRELETSIMLEAKILSVLND